MAKENWKEKVICLDDDALLQDLEDMLICEGFGMRDIFSSVFPDVVLHKLYKRVHLRFSLEKESSLHHVLLEISHVHKADIESSYMGQKSLKSF